MGKEKRKGKKDDASSSKTHNDEVHPKRTKTPKKKENIFATVAIRPYLPKVMISSLAYYNILIPTKMGYIKILVSKNFNGLVPKTKKTSNVSYRICTMICINKLLWVVDSDEDELDENFGV